VKCLCYISRGRNSYCKQLASNVKLATGKYEIISRQLGSFEVLFSRPAEVSVAVGELFWGKNFHFVKKVTHLFLYLFFLLKIQKQHTKSIIYMLTFKI
jgi:hypothetical protein